MKHSPFMADAFVTDFDSSLASWKNYHRWIIQLKKTQIPIFLEVTMQLLISMVFYHEWNEIDNFMHILTFHVPLKLVNWRQTIQEHDVTSGRHDNYT